ncbi:MAG: PaaI family thioesterase [Spirochaetes bacterium]|nr:PaaI family thioesterase [Spirochaetota bacterium]
MENKAIQDLYSDDYSQCYGCGRLNEGGLQIKTYWNGKEGICTFKPHSNHTSLAGFAYGGLIASVIDCNGTATAAAAAYEAEGREFGSDPEIRFVTASLHVDYLKPTPIEGPLEVTSVIKEIKGKKVIIETDLKVGDVLCAKGEMVAVKVPATMLQGK